MSFQAHPSCEKSDDGTCDSGSDCNDLRPNNFAPIDRDMLVTRCNLTYDMKIIGTVNGRDSRVADTSTLVDKRATGKRGGGGGGGMEYV